MMLSALDSASNIRDFINRIPPNHEVTIVKVKKTSTSSYDEEGEDVASVDQYDHEDENQSPCSQYFSVGESLDCYGINYIDSLIDVLSSLDESEATEVLEDDMILQEICEYIVEQEDEEEEEESEWGDINIEDEEDNIGYFEMDAEDIDDIDIDELDFEDEEEL